MPWKQLVIEAGSLDPDALESALFALGALSVSIEDAGDEPILEPAPGSTPVWSNTRLKALFEDGTRMGPIREELAARLGLASLPEHRDETLADRQWERVWLEDFNQAMNFGQRLWVCPGEHLPPDKQAVCVHLDPGLAFGTGTHPSTAGCLQWLDAHPPQGLRVLDYGCGSGILAIAAQKLGARRVVGVDNDPQALIATDANATRNAVAGAIQSLPPQRLAAVGYDLVLANILARPLLSLAPVLSALAAPGARIVLAGILTEQADAVMARYAPWFTLQTTALREDWVLLSGTRHSSN